MEIPEIPGTYFIDKLADGTFGSLRTIPIVNRVNFDKRAKVVETLAITVTSIPVNDRQFIPTPAQEELIELKILHSPEQAQAYRDMEKLFGKKP